MIFRLSHTDANGANASFRLPLPVRLEVKKDAFFHDQFGQFPLFSLPQFGEVLLETGDLRIA